jgi:single-strand DNA-binding protein
VAQDNFVALTGNMTREPELRFTSSGQATCQFGLAVNRSWTDRQTQEKKEQVSFFDVVCWGSLAENVATSLPRGTRVTVTGRLEQRSWETQEGDKRSKVEVNADSVSPDLRWATVGVTRNERREGTPVPNSPPAAPGGAYNPDEEPF